MNPLMMKLEAWGCDIKSTMRRVADDELFYIDCLHDIVEDPYFAKLKEAIDRGNVSQAFDAAHTLKGVLSNLGLTPMYNKVVEIVEPLRAGSREDLSDKYEQLAQMRVYLKKLLAQA
ncbi:MAG: Hpt domain-containing protein [Desulfovibrionaceae bacterium]|nr:Hpt domain-containing protein [Desulfovibrionaceae bacterium]